METGIPTIAELIEEYEYLSDTGTQQHNKSIQENDTTNTVGWR